MIRKLMYLLLAISLGLNAGFLVARLTNHAAGPAPAQPDRRPGDKSPRPPEDWKAILRQHMDVITRRLDLSEEQQAQIRTELAPRLQRLVEVRRRVPVIEEELSNAFASRELDRERFWALVHEMSASRAEMDSLAAEMLMAEAERLKPEQRAHFAEVAPIITRVSPQGEPPPPRERGPADPGPPPRHP